MHEIIVKGSDCPLSNFWEEKFTFRGVTFLTAEGAYHAWKSGKYVDGFQKLIGIQAKMMGHTVKADYSLNLELMKEILLEKAAQVPRFRYEVTAPGKFVHPVGDRFWAEKFCEILSEVRDVLVSRQTQTS